MINSIVAWAGGGFWAWVFAICLIGGAASGAVAIILSAVIALKRLFQ